MRTQDDIEVTGGREGRVQQPPRDPGGPLRWVIPALSVAGRGRHAGGGCRHEAEGLPLRDCPPEPPYACFCFRLNLGAVVSSAMMDGIHVGRCRTSWDRDPGGASEAPRRRSWARARCLDSGVLDKVIRLCYGVCNLVEGYLQGKCVWWCCCNRRACAVVMVVVVVVVGYLQLHMGMVE